MNKAVIQAVKTFFESQDDILLVILYGSQVTDHYTPSSDIDIAIAKKNTITFDEKNRLQLELSVVLKKEIDLLDIQNISGLIHYQVLTTGLCIKKKNNEAEVLYHKHTMKALYWYEDYYPLYNREQKKHLIQKLGI